jgi:hypothetical protein
VASAVPRRADATVWALLLITTLGLLAAASLDVQSQPPTVVIVLGPAEAADSEQANPGLSVTGRARASELVRVIGQQPTDNPIVAVFATRFRLSQETAEPIARHLDLPMQIVDSSDPEALVQRIDSEFTGRSLVVFTDVAGKRPLLNALLGDDKGDGEFAEDRLYIVTRPRFGTATAVAVRYGSPVTEASES